MVVQSTLLWNKWGKLNTPNLWSNQHSWTEIVIVIVLYFSTEPTTKCIRPPTILQQSYKILYALWGGLVRWSCWRNRGQAGYCWKCGGRVEEVWWLSWGGVVAELQKCGGRGRVLVYMVSTLSLNIYYILVEVMIHTCNKVAACLCYMWLVK